MHALFLCSIFSGFPVDPWFIFKEIAKISSLLDFVTWSGRCRSIEVQYTSVGDIWRYSLACISYNFRIPGWCSCNSMQDGAPCQFYSQNLSPYKLENFFVAKSLT